MGEAVIQATSHGDGPLGAIAAGLDVSGLDVQRRERSDGMRRQPVVPGAIGHLQGPRERGRGIVEAALGDAGPTDVVVAPSDERPGRIALRCVSLTRWNNERARSVWPWASSNSPSAYAVTRSAPVPLPKYRARSNSSLDAQLGPPESDNVDAQEQQHIRVELRVGRRGHRSKPLVHSRPLGSPAQNHACDCARASTFALRTSPLCQARSSAAP